MVFASFLFRNAHFTFADFLILSKEKNITDRENREELKSVKAAFLH